MTENEARLILDVRISRFDHAGDVNEALEIAKQALEEIQQYREIGTVEELKQLKEILPYLKSCRQSLDDVVRKCNEYEKIGTVEECREAVEKQKAKKPEVIDQDFDYYKCPGLRGIYLGNR